MRKIIYVSGSGRTATTMWSILISSQLKIPNLSQSRDYFKAVSRKQECSCGQTAYKCFTTGRNYKHVKRTRLKNKISSYIFTASHLIHELQGSGFTVDSSKSIKHLMLIMIITLRRPLVLEFIRSQDEINNSWRKRDRSEKFIQKMQNKGVSRRLILNFLAKAHIIEKQTYDFSYALKNPDNVINELISQHFPEMEKITDSGGYYEVVHSTQHIFPPADPKYLKEIKEIRVIG